MKISDEELLALQTLNTSKSQLIEELGNLEFEMVLLTNRRKTITEKIPQIMEEEIRLTTLMSEKYGDGALQLDTGEFTKSS